MKSYPRREKDVYFLYILCSMPKFNFASVQYISHVKVCRVRRLFLVENAELLSNCFLSSVMQVICKTVFIQKMYLCLESRFSHVLELFPLSKIQRP
jgi:hypothetical protein